MASTGTLGYGGIFKEQMEISVILPKGWKHRGRGVRMDFGGLG